MKSFISYIFKGYLLTVVTIMSITMLETIISNHIDNTVDESTPFDSPIIVSLICGALYPIYNLPVIIILYKCVHKSHDESQAGTEPDDGF